jgi:arginyl-tRNA--protein-N-Asp/Glu arginylyltransferase
LQLGTFSSLVELAYVTWMADRVPVFRWYYQGFYIQSTHKMAYKGDFEPALLVCPKSYAKVPLDAPLRQKIA